MEQEKIISYKGFGKDFKCRGFQYEVSKEYKEKFIKCCHKGFHACENPMDVWKYYDITDSRFAIVEQSGKIDKKGNKTCSSIIKIKSELNFANFVKLCVDAVIDKCKSISGSKLNDNGSYSAQIGSTGCSVRIASSGNNTRISSCGTSVQIGSSGNDVRIASSGNEAQIGSSGNDVRIASSGNEAQIGSNGNSARIGSSSNFAQIGSTGYSARIASSGNNVQIGSCGNNVQIGSCGDYAQIGSCGDYAQICSSGNSVQIKSEGQDAVIMCTGKYSKARAKKGSWITLAEYDNYGKPVCVKTEQVDGERIKEDIWYQLIDGEFKEVD